MQAIFHRRPYIALVSRNGASNDNGDRLKRFRKAAGLSQRELAEKIGVIHSNVNFWENNGKLPRSDVLVPMARALGVTVEELLGEPKPRANAKPRGKLGEVFDKVSRLPRRQQQKVVEMAEGFLALHEKE